MQRRKRLVGTLWRWHRRLGLAAFVLLLMLAMTGIALNHSDRLGLDQQVVGARFVQKLYGVEPVAIPAYRLGERWLSRAPSGTVYLDAQPVAPCRGELVGAAELDGLLYAGCELEFLVITPAGQLVESFTPGTGLPERLSAVGLVGDSLALAAGGQWVLADFDRATFSAAVEPGAAVVQIAPGALPEPLRSRIPQGLEWMTWERVLLDIHSGRLAGPFGVLLVDAAGVLLCLLAASGVFMWWLRRRRFQASR